MPHLVHANFRNLHDTSYCPDVGLKTVTFLLQHLRGNVVRCPTYSPETDEKSTGEKWIMMKPMRAKHTNTDHYYTIISLMIDK